MPEVLWTLQWDSAAGELLKLQGNKIAVSDAWYIMHYSDEGVSRIIATSPAGVVYTSYRAVRDSEEE